MLCHFVRPAFTTYVSGESPALDIDAYVRALPHGNPNAPNRRLYAQFSQATTNYGAIGAINGHWAGDWPSSPDFVINELSSWCVDGSGNVRDLVGIVTGRLPIVYGSGYRLGAEYAINGT